MRRRWPLVAVKVAAAALAVAGLAASAVVAGTPAKEGGRGRAAPAVIAAVPVVHRAAAPTGPPPTLVVTLHAATSYRSAPGGAVAGSLPALNPFGAPEVLAVIGPVVGGWAHVELPIRPNGSTGWIHTAGVSLSETPYRVRVNLEARSLSVYDGTKLVLTTPAAVGKPSTPTPPDHTYLWELIRPDNPNGAYGPYIFGLAEFSDSYSVFNGGDAQIGIHGQDEPWSVGLAVSHGCVRLGNDMITRLAGMLPLGTPVTLS